MALKDVIARVQAKQEAKYQERQKAKAATVVETQAPQNEGNPFSADEVAEMERAAGARIAGKTR